MMGRQKGLLLVKKNKKIKLWLEKGLFSQNLRRLFGKNSASSLA